MRSDAARTQAENAENQVQRCKMGLEGIISQGRVQNQGNKTLRARETPSSITESLKDTEKDIARRKKCFTP